MKNYIIKGLASLFLVGSMASCSDNYLNTEVIGAIDSDRIASTVENAKKTLYGACWSMYYVNEAVPAQAYMGGESAMAMFYGETPGQDCLDSYLCIVTKGSWDMFLKMEQINNSDYIWTQSMWVYAYQIIGQCNELLAQIDGAEGDPIERDMVKAEALTMRAHAYWRLMQCYAPRWIDSQEGNAPCVVLRLEPTTADMPVVSCNEVYDQLYKDLEWATEAYEVAEEKGFKPEFHWEPSKNVCYGTFARIALLKNDWETAATMANKAREGYSLMTNDEYHKGHCTPNGEWMWWNSQSQKDSMVYADWGTPFTANGYYACNTEYGGLRINIDLYDLIPETDIRRDFFLTEDKIGQSRERMYNDKMISKDDQKIKAVKLLKSAKDWMKENTPEGYGVPYQQKNEESTPLIAFGTAIKFLSANGETGPAAPAYMRAAEMYLTEAEALAMQGNKDPQAQAIMNELNKVRDANYDCTATGDELIKEIRLYRRIELWGEGFNWFDLKRWNEPIVRRIWKADDPTSGNYPAWMEAELSTTIGNGWTYAIPKAETQYNKLTPEI